MGTQRFRSSTLPAVRRTLRRIRAERRLPRHIVTNLLASWRRRRRALAARIGRWSPARRRLQRQATDGRTVVRTPSGWRLAAPTDAVSSQQLLARHFAAAFSALAAASAEPFVTEPRNRSGPRIGVPEEHRANALRALDAGGFTMAAAGPDGGTHRVGATPSRVLAWFDHLIGGGQGVGADLAIEIEFWRPEVIGMVVPDGRHGIASFVPDPEPAAQVMLGDRSYPTHSTFQAEIESRRMPGPIDIVYTWVDGSDPEWRSSYEEHLGAAGRLNREAANPSRYTSRDELRYSMRSLWWYADFFRQVFLVTAGHLPPWLDRDHPRITVVDHRDIFPDPEATLPTFNSHAIESRLHHIDGLSEHYLYLNDDMFFGRIVEPSLFFSSNGVPNLFLSSAPIPPGPADEHDAPVDAAAKNGRRLLADAIGYTPARKLRHAPYPQVRSIVAEVADRFADEVAATTAARFRSPGDISLASSLSQHYAYATGRAVIGDIASHYVNIADRWAPAHLADLLERRDRDAFCLNETAMDGVHPDRIEREVEGFLEGYFPRRSPFEGQSSSNSPPV